MKTQENVHLLGRTKIFKNGVLHFDSGNVILGGLRQYTAESMNDGTVNKAIDDLFTDTYETITNDDLPYTGAQANKDGIVISGSITSMYGATGPASLSVRIMKTEDIASEASGTHARKWRGTFVAQGAASAAAALLGHNLTFQTEGSSIHPFAVEYARQSFTTVVLAGGDQLTIEWEVQVA